MIWYGRLTNEGLTRLLRPGDLWKSPSQGWLIYTDKRAWKRYVEGKS